MKKAIVGLCLILFLPIVGVASCNSLFEDQLSFVSDDGHYLALHSFNAKTLSIVDLQSSTRIQVPESVLAARWRPNTNELVYVSESFQVRLMKMKSNQISDLGSFALLRHDPLRAGYTVKPNELILKFGERYDDVVDLKSLGSYHPEKQILPRGVPVLHPFDSRGRFLRITFATGNRWLLRRVQQESRGLDLTRKVIQASKVELIVNEFKTVNFDLDSGEIYASYENVISKAGE